MSGRLPDLEVLVLDFQAAGATPAHGDLIEAGWAVCSAAGGAAAVQSRWIVPRTERRVPRAVRELTGWTEASLEHAVHEQKVWEALRGVASSPMPTVIHYSRFELPFLRDLHERLGDGSAFPFDVVCVHAVAARLFPDLPRRNIRALAGHLGHSPELVRRAAGHVEATAFIWRELVPLLGAAGVSSWDELKSWLGSTSPAARPKKRTFPLSPERRKSLPDRPGVYRFLRKSGDILYVGKATSLKKRIAGHFKSGGPTTERALELLTQVHDIHHVETESVLEAALLETDEIKRIDPPYNVQLRSLDRSAWFASRDLRDTRPVPDDAHRVGPLPSARALSPFSALIALADGESSTPSLRARALAVPVAFGPDESLFAAGWDGFRRDHLGSGILPSQRALLAASLAVWVERGHAETEPPREETAPDTWDLARVLRRLERALVQGGLLFRRARLLGLLADASVAFRERGAPHARGLVISGAAVVDRVALDASPGDTPSLVRAVETLALSRPRSRHTRQSSFDAHAYDRLRVLVTELRRVNEDGGEVVIRVGRHIVSGTRLLGWLHHV